jgi:hypothetical protein
MYNFKKNVKAYIVYSGATHRIDLYSDITASQTFDEQGYKRKTLHNLTDLHDHAVVNKANPANFSFTTPIPNIGYPPVILNLGSDYSSGTLSSFDLYIQSDNVIYVLNNCVVESMAFNVEMRAVLTVSVSGTSSKLAKFGNVGGAARIPGLADAENRFGRTYTTVDRLNISISNVTLDSIAAVHMDLKNDINWGGYTTINQAVTSTMMYPDSYVLQGRTLSGSITQFITSQNSDTLFDTSTSSPVDISIYYLGYSATNPLLRFTLPSAVFTRRLNFEELINRVYDFRLNSNSTIVEPIYKTAKTATAMNFSVPANSGLIALIN